MTDRPRSVWARFDAFSEDDPAVSRLREALQLEPVPEDAPEVVQDAPGPAQPSRRDLIAAALARFHAGDSSALDELRRLMP